MLLNNEHILLIVSEKHPDVPHTDVQSECRSALLRQKKRHRQKIAVLARYLQFSNWKAVSVCELELHQQCHCYILPTDISTGQIFSTMIFLYHEFLYFMH